MKRAIPGLRILEKKYTYILKIKKSIYLFSPMIDLDKKEIDLTEQF